MSEQKNAEDVQVPLPAKMWAVIQTGYITRSADPIVFRDEQGNKTPQVIRIVTDRETAEKMRQRLSHSHGKVAKINGINNPTATPLYAVAEVEGPVAKKRKPMTDEQKAQFVARTQAARKRGRGRQQNAS